MIWLKILAAVGIVYLLIGLLAAVARIMAHDMPWQLFVFTILFWPTLFLP